MGLKDEILKQFESSRGTSYSGADLAKRYGVSRAAVWKAVKSLQKEGFAIQATTNRGYTFLAANDRLTEAGIAQYISFPCRLRVEKSVGSTNDEVKKLAEAGGDEWDCVIAEEQTKGRGRYNRKFVSTEGTGVYISILLRPKFSAAETLFITTCAAVAVCEAIEKISGKSVGIKWVNDVLLNGKKVCGILTEASYDVESGGLSYAVVGIGVNVLFQKFPAELAGIAGTVFEEGEYPQEGRARIAAEIIERFRYYYERIPQRTFFAEYKRRSLVIGKRVKVFSGNIEGWATALDLDENCFLKVRFDDGNIKLLSSGEVSIRI